jgi:hypothetical protein
MRVTEVIHVNHELDLLEAHIVEASKYAARIVIKEGEANWHGHEKPLHVSDNWDRFRKYSKAELMVIPAGEFVRDPQDKKEMCLNESRTRTYGWQDVSDSVDYVIECDVDEIINPQLYPELEREMWKNRYRYIAVKYHNYIWYMNNVLGRHTEYRVFNARARKMLLNPKGRPRTTVPDTIGWHFSGCVLGEDWGKKYTDMNFIYGFTNEEIGDFDWNDCREKGLYPDKHRDLHPLVGNAVTEVDLRDYPEFVRAHPELYPWRGGPEFTNGG